MTYVLFTHTQFGSHIGTKQQEDQRNEHDDDEPNVQCAQQ